MCPRCNMPGTPCILGAFEARNGGGAFCYAHYFVKPWGEPCPGHTEGQERESFVGRCERCTLFPRLLHHVEGRALCGSCEGQERGDPALD